MAKIDQTWTALAETATYQGVVVPTQPSEIEAAAAWMSKIDAPWSVPSSSAPVAEPAAPSVLEDEAMKAWMSKIDAPWSAPASAAVAAAFSAAEEAAKAAWMAKVADSTSAELESASALAQTPSSA